MFDENEDILYTWVREYHWDVCTTQSVNFNLISNFSEICFLNALTGTW